MRPQLNFTLYADAYRLTALAVAVLSARTGCPLQWPHQPVAHS